MYKLLCFAPDGEFITERDPDNEDGLFKTVDDVWDAAANLGSKWYFYPLCFAADENNRIVEAPDALQWELNGVIDAGQLTAYHLADWLERHQEKVIRILEA